MAPLAGRPPYATDHPDSYYAQQPNQQQPTARRQPENKNKRSSAYDVYDNYLEPGKDGSNRNSGAGAVGFGFLNGSMDDDSDDEDTGRKPMDPHHAPVSIPVPNTVPTSKHAALAAATAAVKTPSPPPPAYNAPVQQQRQAAIAAPRPGYAAPINNLNNVAAAAQPRTPSHGSHRQHPGDIAIPPSSGQYGPSSPSPTAPHPLQAPITPIQPVFAARPRPPKPDVKFQSDIMRGDKEETLMARRGEKGDDFWRRFSMVIKTEGTTRGEKTSGWLSKTQQGTSRFSRWVWIVGIILIISAAGGIGLGWYVSHKAPDHQQPTAIGGSANELGSTGTTSESLKTVGPGGATAKSSLHVSPTNTVARREPLPTGVPIVLRELVAEEEATDAQDKRDIGVRHRRFGRRH